MKVIDRYFLLAAFAIISLGSCNKILNPDVIDIPTANNALQSSSDIEKAVAGGYDLLRAVVPDKLFLMGEMRANLFSSPSQTSNVRVETPIPDNTVNGLLGNGGGDWEGFYRTISQCNLIIETIPTISLYPNDERQRHLGEAHFLRAISYFNLLRFWGDVPIVTSSIDLRNIPKSTQKDVADLINNDLDIAINNLRISYQSENLPTRATKGAAWAIKAHLAAWMQDFNLAEKLCDSVINLGGYKLINDSIQLQNMFVGKSIESIFELNFDAAAKEVQKCRIFNRTLGSPWYKDVSDGGSGRNDLLLTPTSDQMNEMFPAGTNDLRKYIWFVKESFDASKYSRVYFGKYRTLQLKGDTTTQNINESNIILTRLADIILLRAEALANPSVGRVGEAIGLLNEIRERAGIKKYTSGGSLQDTILLERRRELIGEGHFFFDLVRTRKLAQYSKIKDIDWYEKGAWLLPINQNVITKSNNEITQNSYWK